ncbi:MAG: AAA family ATPase [Candidatus Helarchaeota archaeon]
MVRIDEIQEITLLGSFHNDTCFKCVSLIKYQYKRNISDGVKGVLFYGIPGNGKTTTAFKIVEKIYAELGHRDSWKEHMIFTDCGDLAHYRYGETEKKIKDVFRLGLERSKNIAPIIYLFDDADGLFITRDWGVKLEAWYLGHLNVFFHQIDNLNTSKEFIILTTNRVDLIDSAIRDRLFEIEFPEPNSEVKIELMKAKAGKLKLDDKIQESMEQELINSEKIKSLRDVENFVLMQYLEEVWKKGGSIN